MRIKNEYDAHKSMKACKPHRCVMSQSQGKAASMYIKLRKYGMPRWLASMISGI